MSNRQQRTSGGSIAVSLVDRGLTLPSPAEHEAQGELPASDGEQLQKFFELSRSNPVFAAALKRGATAMNELVAREDMLSFQQVCEQGGLDEQEVMRLLETEQIVAIPKPDGGYVFPNWQFDKRGRPFEGIDRITKAFGTSGVGVYRYLVMHHGELNGITGVEALRAGRIDDLIMVADSIGWGNFS